MLDQELLLERTECHLKALLASVSATPHADFDSMAPFGEPAPAVKPQPGEAPSAATPATPATPESPATPAIPAMPSGAIRLLEKDLHLSRARRAASYSARRASS